MVSSINGAIIPALTLGAITSWLSLTANRNGALIEPGTWTKTNLDLVLRLPSSI